MVPFGNAYFNTSQCGQPSYDRDAVGCFRKLCGGSHPSPDCFSGPLLCQHGEDECFANRLEGCAFKTAKFPSWVPFVACYEKDGDLSKSNAQRCAAASGLQYGQMAACATGSEGSKVDVANARRTLAYSGDWMGTPTVTVNGQTLTNPAEPGQLINAVCKAYKGPHKPSGCK